MAAMQVLKMTLGELDYNTMMVDSLNQMNPETNAPLLPYRESSTIFMVIFIFAMSIILMNLLVSRSYNLLITFSLLGKINKELKRKSCEMVLTSCRRFVIACHTIFRSRE